MPHKDPEVRRTYYAAWYSANIEDRRIKDALYHLAHREKRIAYAVTYYAAHREERLASEAAERLANPEKFRLKEAAFRAKHPERILVKNASRRALQRGAIIRDFSTAQWKEMKEHYGFACVYCGRKMQHLTMDHITPLSHGGNHTLHNIVPACQSCNSKKRNKRPLVPVQPMLLTLASPKRSKKKILQAPPHPLRAMLRRRAPPASRMS